MTQPDLGSVHRVGLTGIAFRHVIQTPVIIEIPPMNIGLPMGKRDSGKLSCPPIIMKKRPPGMDDILVSVVVIVAPTQARSIIIRNQLPTCDVHIEIITDVPV